MEKENNRNASNERRRKLISINNQIDKIQDVYFRNYTQNVDRRISSLAERQSRMLSQLYDTMDKEERERIKKSFADRQDALKRSLDDWRGYNQQIRSDLTLADRFASNVFYWNRRRDLRDLEREARYRFDDIRDEAEELAEDMSTSFSSVADSLRDWATALNVNQLASGMEDTTMSLREIRSELKKHMELTDEQWNSIRDQAAAFSKETDYAISNLEYLENMTAIVKFGYDDQELAAMLAEVTSKFEKMTGVAADQMGNVFEVSMLEGMGGEEYVRKLTSQMMKIQQTSGLYTNAEDLMTAYDESLATLRMQAGGDNELLSTYLDQLMALRTASNASYLDGLDTKLIEIMSTPITEMSDGMHMLGGAQIQQLMQAGLWEDAAKLYTTNLSSRLGQISDPAMRNEFLNQLGFDDPEFQAKIMESQNIEDFFTSYDQAMSIIDDQATTATKFIDEWKPSVTALEKLSNQFKASEVGSFLDDLSSELDITLAEAMLIGSGAINIGKTLAGGVKGLGKLFGLGKTASAAGGTAAATKSFLGFSSGGAGVLNHTLLGSTGNAMMSGTGLLGGLANTGSTLVAAGGGGSVAGGAAALAGGASIAGGILGGASLISGIADIATAGTQETWQEEADQVTEGAIKIGGTAAAAGVGAAIGSIVPGIGTAVGALVGAGVGGLATLIWGDDWAQQLQDSLDGTKDINEAIEILNTNATELEVALSRDQEFDNLITQYEDLRDQMDIAVEGTDDYKLLQEQLNGVVADINQIYPGYIDLNNDDYELMDKQIAVTQKLADAELALYKARLLGSGDEVAEGVASAYEQYTKSESTYDSAVAESEQYADYVEWMSEVQSLVQSGGLVWDETYNTMKQGTISDDEYQKFLDNAENYLRTGEDVNGKGFMSQAIIMPWTADDNILSWAYDEWLTARDNIDFDVSTEAADLAEKEATLANMLTTQMAQYESLLSAESWEAVAENWSTADATDKSMLLQIGKLYDSVGSEFHSYLPDMVALEELAEFDFTGDGNIGRAHGGSGGHFAIGLDRVPYDNFPAYLHKDEAVLTAEEAEVWRQATAGWTPNDKSSLLSKGDTIIINQTEAADIEEDEDASLTEVIETLKWLGKEIKKTIEDTANSSDAQNLNSASVLNFLTKTRTTTPADSIFSFMRT